MRFTGFWETNGADAQVSTTIKYLEAGELLERLRVRLAEVEPGTHIRIDLIAWGDED
jgi:hypothetical protein